MQIKKQIREAVIDSLYDVGISAEELRIRKISTARVLDQAKKALDIAESSGQEGIAKQLQNKIGILQDWLDHADELPTADSDDISDGSDRSVDNNTEDTRDSEESPSGSKDLEDESDEDSDEDDTDDSDEDDDAENVDNSDTDDIEDDDIETINNDDSENGAEDEDNTEDKDENEESDSEDNLESSSKNNTEEEDESSESTDNKNDDADDSDDVDDTDDSSSTSKEKEKSEEEDSGTSSKDADEEDTEHSEEEEEDENSGASENNDGTTEDEEDNGEDRGDDTSDGSEVDEGDDDDSIEDPDEVLIDPFKNPALSASLPKDIDPSKVESVFDASKRILGKLSGESRRGAVDAIKGLLSKRGIHVEESLHEALSKHLTQLSDDEFNDELAATMAIVDKVIKVDYSDDLDARVAEIKRDASSAISRMELEREDAEYTKDEHETVKSHVKASEKEREKYSKVKGLSGLDVFKSTLYRAVKDQVDEAEDEIETWAALDRRHEDDPSIIVKGKALDDLDSDIPSINVYFDQSGSWTNGDIEKGIRAISVINEFHERKEIKLNIYYMSAGGIFTTASAARRHGGAEGWAAALKHIKDTKVKNAIILSDEDLDYYEWSNRPTGNNGRTIIDGCVWWLWKDAEVSKKALKELLGRRGNFQYQFEGSGY